jgi:hypothetical protein
MLSTSVVSATQESTGGCLGAWVHASNSNVTRPLSGRQSVDPEHRSASIHVRVSAPTYDALYLVAQREGTTIPAVIRELIARAPRCEDDDGDE